MFGFCNFSIFIVCQLFLFSIFYFLKNMFDKWEQNLFYKRRGTKKEDTFCSHVIKFSIFHFVFSSLFWLENGENIFKPVSIFCYFGVVLFKKLFSFPNHPHTPLISPSSSCMEDSKDKSKLSARIFPWAWIWSNIYSLFTSHIWFYE